MRMMRFAVVMTVGALLLAGCMEKPKVLRLYTWLDYISATDSATHPHRIISNFQSDPLRHLSRQVDHLDLVLLGSVNSIGMVLQTHLDGIVNPSR